MLLDRTNYTSCVFPALKSTNHLLPQSTVSCRIIVWHTEKVESVRYYILYISNLNRNFMIYFWVNHISPITIYLTHVNLKLLDICQWDKTHESLFCTTYFIAKQNLSFPKDEWPVILKMIYRKHAAKPDLFLKVFMKSYILFYFENNGSHKAR